MVFAKLHYRENVPSDTIAWLYAKVDFKTENKALVKELDKLFGLVENYKRNVKTAKINELEAKKDKLIKKIEKLTAQKHTLKRNSKVLIKNPNLTPEEEAVIADLNLSYRYLKNDIKVLKEDLNYKPSDLKDKFQDVLYSLGFKNISREYDKEKLIESEEFEFTGNEAELLSNAKKAYTTLENKLDKEISNNKECSQNDQMGM